MGTPHHYAEVIKHFADGGEIQFRPCGASEHAWKNWTPTIQFPDFSDGRAEWRIRPASAPIELPRTNFANAELINIYMDYSMENGSTAFVAVANAAIRRAIEDGQVVLAPGAVGGKPPTQSVWRSPFTVHAEFIEGYKTAIAASRKSDPKSALDQAIGSVFSSAAKGDI
jgi:hypothetical protein